MSDTRKIGIMFGAMAEKFSVQLRKQGWKFDEKIMESFQEDFKAVFRIRLHDLLTDSQFDKILGKLHSEIVKHVRKENKEK